MSDIIAYKIRVTNLEAELLGALERAARAERERDEARKHIAEIHAEIQVWIDFGVSRPDMDAFLREEARR